MRIKLVEGGRKEGKKDENNGLTLNGLGSAPERVSYR